MIHYIIISLYVHMYIFVRTRIHICSNTFSKYGSINLQIVKLFKKCDGDHVFGEGII